MFSIRDLKEFQPQELLAYVVVFLSPVLLGVVSLFVFFPSAIIALDYQKLILIAAVIPMLIELAFLGIALGAMNGEIDMRIRARAAALSGASFFLISGIIGIFFSWYSSSTALVISLSIGWVLLGIAIRHDTTALELELEVWRAGRKPSERSSHFYWTRREEIFKSLKPIDWDAAPPMR